MKILSITRKDLKVFFRDPGALVQLFVLPIVFILVFTGLAVSSSAEKEEVKIELPVVDLDKTASSQSLLQSLSNAGGLQIREMEQTAALNAVDEEQINLLLTVPKGYNTAVENQQPVTLVLFSREPGSSDAQSALMIVSGVTREISLDTHLLASLRQMGEMNADDPNEMRVFTAEKLLAQAESQMTAARTRPLVSVVSGPPSAMQEREDVFNPSQFIVPGFTVLFAFLAAQVTARSIFDEKKTGTFRRLLSAPLSKAELLSGKMTPNILLVLVQVLVIFLTGILIFPLMGIDRLDLGNDLFALSLAMLMTAICSATLGVLIAALARTVAQVSGVSQVILWVSGILSGALVPLALMNVPLLNSVSRVFPQTYAVNAFQDLLVRGYYLPEILPDLGMLLVFSIAFLLFGIWRFKFN